MTPDKVVCIGLLLIVILIILSFSIYSDLCNQSPEQPTPNILPMGGEVYHLSNNVYTYDDAVSACAKYGGQLATKEQIEAAYQNGANWCSYGWSLNGEAYYPIQKDYYSKLTGKNKSACGNVGINGGKFNNRSLKFGANCYGPRPSKEQLKDEDTIASFSDTWMPDGTSKMETFVCNGQRIPVLNLDDGYDKLHKF